MSAPDRLARLARLRGETKPGPDPANAARIHELSAEIAELRAACPPWSESTSRAHTSIHEQIARKQAELNQLLSTPAKPGAPTSEQQIAGCIALVVLLFFGLMLTWFLFDIFLISKILD
jgi:hypothetical protein